MLALKDVGGLQTHRIHSTVPPNVRMEYVVSFPYMSVWVGEMVLKKHGNLSSYPQHKHKSGYSAMSVTPALAGRGKWILRTQ